MNGYTTDTLSADSLSGIPGADGFCDTALHFDGQVAIGDKQRLDFALRHDIEADDQPTGELGVLNSACW